MKKVFLFTFIFFFLHTNAQIKKDTIFSGLNAYPNIFSSKTEKINLGLKIICNNSKFSTEKKLHENSELQTMVLLNDLNNYLKTNLFSEYDCFIISYYCNTGDLFTETRLFEFFFESEAKAKRCVQLINKLIKESITNKNNDNFIWNHIGTINWYCVSNNNRVYFVHTRESDDENPMRIVLENKIKEVLNE